MTVEPMKIDRDWAHRLALGLWHERESNPKLINVNKRLRDLFDIAHSHGISFIATVVSLLFVLGFCIRLGRLSYDFQDVSHTIGVIILGVLALWLFWGNYERALRFSHEVSMQALLDVLYDEKATVKIRTHFLTTANTAESNAVSLAPSTPPVRDKG